MGGTLVTNTTTNNVIGERTLYAQWTAVANYYTVTYNANEGTLSGASTQDYTIAGLISFPTAPTRDGYTFDGWYTTSGDDGVKVATDSPASSITLYAHWNLAP